MVLNKVSFTRWTIGYTLLLNFLDFLDIYPVFNISLYPVVKRKTLFLVNNVLIIRKKPSKGEDKRKGFS